MSIEMRETFGNTMAELMQSDARIILLDADLSKPNGTHVLKDRYADRMVNVGVQEANMASVAAGLATYHFVPFITSFCAFASRRVFDQAAISIAYAKTNVKIVGTDPGVTAELNGGTHMSFEDAGIMRTLPGMIVFEPCDNIQLEKALPQIAAIDGPVYIRMFRKSAPKIFEHNYSFDLFSADILQQGDDVSFFTSGIEVEPAMEAAKTLGHRGISAEIVNVHTWKPIDRATIINSVRKTGAAVTCENHSIIGGLGSAVCEVTASEFPVPVERIGAKDRFGIVGRLDELMQEMELTAQHIVDAAMKVMAAKPSQNVRGET